MTDAVLTGNFTSDTSASLLSSLEQKLLALRLTLALIAAGLLVLSFALRFLEPDQRDIAELVAGGAAFLVSIPALSAAWQSLRYPDLHGITDQLIALALIAAWADGDLTTAAVLPLVMTIGHVLEERSLIGSQEAINALSRLTQTKARRLLPDGQTEEIPAQNLRVGDLVSLLAGDRMPADGIVRSGHASVDTAPITGESVPVELSSGSEVFGGSINLDGQLVAEITLVGEKTTLGRVIALMQSAERAKPPVTRLLERYASRYMILVLLVAAGTWFATNDTAAMLAVLVASCPCALVLAAPATSIAAIAVAGRHGILIKSAAFLEHLATVDSVILDKTGTVTLGELRLVEAVVTPGMKKADLLRIAASLGAMSNHPVSRALAHLSPANDRLSVVDINEKRGLGVTAVFDGEILAVGRPELFEGLGVQATPAPAHHGPIAGVSRGASFLGWILLADEPRPEAREAIADLKALSITRQLLLTGDRAVVAHDIARALDIYEVRAEALPQQKMECVLEEIRAGYRPMVIGDGINDSLALKAGAVGIAMGAKGADVALASADLVLMTNDLRRLGTCVRLSRRCRRTIYVNVTIGLGWTIVVIALAASGILGAGGALIAALLHNFGTLVVMGNAGRLLKFQET
jgi:Cd2+/Zn2+-exporting ATPase